MKQLAVLVVGMGLFWWGGDCVDSLAAKTSRSGRTQHQFVSPSDFQRILLSELNDRFGRPGHELTLSILFPKKALPIPRGDRRFEVAPITDGGRTGRRAFRVSVFSNKKFVKTVNVVGNLKAKARVVIPSRWMRTHEVIEAGDLSSTLVNLPSLTHDFFLKSHAVLGKQVLRPLPPRQPIRKSSVEEPPQVHKGDRVMIEVRQGGLLVQTVGLAKAAGKTGETIPIKNQQSGREVLGRVIAAGLVQVGF